MAVRAGFLMMEVHSPSASTLCVRALSCTRNCVIQIGATYTRM